MRKTVESMLQGQPDKVCDQIADILWMSIYVVTSPCGCECNGFAQDAYDWRRVSSTADFDVGAIAKKVYTDIGYTDDINVCEY